MKKKMLSLVFACAVIFSLTVPVFAGVQYHDGVSHKFYASMQTDTYEFFYPNIGANEQDYTCDVPGAYYLLKLNKKTLFGSNQVGATFNFDVNRGVTLCARWENANSNGAKYYFSYYPYDNAWSNDPNSRVWIKGFSIYLSEE